MISWKSRRALVGALVGAAALALGGSALAAGGSSPGKAKVTIKGGETIVPNQYLKISFSFDPGAVPIRSGGTVTLTNLTKEGHTLSIVKPSQIPHTAKQLERCRECFEIVKAHGINLEGPPTSGPPPHLVVNVGAEGFNVPGDSVVIGPQGRGGPVKFKVTAKPGATLHFICAFHPWMQGTFKVTK